MKTSGRCRRGTHIVTLPQALCCRDPVARRGVAYSRKFHAARDAPTTLTIGGLPCADVICWPYLRGEECLCDGKLAHIFRNGFFVAPDVALVQPPLDVRGTIITCHPRPPKGCWRSVAR